MRQPGHHLSTAAQTAQATAPVRHPAGHSNEADSCCDSIDNRCGARAAHRFDDVQVYLESHYQGVLSACACTGAGRNARRAAGSAAKRLNAPVDFVASGVLDPSPLSGAVTQPPLARADVHMAAAPSPAPPLAGAAPCLPLPPADVRMAASFVAAAQAPALLDVCEGPRPLAHAALGLTLNPKPHTEGERGGGSGELTLPGLRGLDFAAAPMPSQASELGAGSACPCLPAAPACLWRPLRAATPV